MRFDELISLLPKDEHVYITGHVHPDGDCIGAALGLNQLLKKENYDTTLLLQERPEVYEYLSGFRSIKTYAEMKAGFPEMTRNNYSFIVLDSGDLTRIEPVRSLFDSAARTVNIDHHDSNTLFADYNHVDAKASSTSEMIGLMLGLDRLLPETDSSLKYPDKGLCECLYTGIIYDTGVFKHSNTRKETHLVAAGLTEAGVDHTFMINHLFFRRSRKSVNALTLAMDRLEYHLEGKILSTYLTYDDLMEHQLVKSDTEHIVSFLNEIQGGYASVFLLEIETGSFKGSFRSDSNMNVCKVAKHFGGGGHIKAAGCTISGTADEVKDRVLKELEIEYQRHYQHI